MAKIVFVDDETGLLDVMRNVFSELGHEFFSSENGNDGLNLILEKEPKIAFVDELLSGLNGLEILKIIKTQKPHIKVVIFTGVQDREIDKEAIRLGAIACLHKPTPLKTILKIVEQASQN